MNWLTIAVLAFLLLAAVYGYRRGLARMVISIVSLVLSLVLVFILRAPVEKIVREHTGLEHTVEQFVNDNLGTRIREVAAELPGTVGEQLEQSINGLKLPEPVQKLLLDAVSGRDDAASKSMNMADYLTSWVSGLIFSCLIFVITFILVRLIVWVVCLLIINASKLPGIRQVNSLAGAVIGLVIGLFAVWIAAVAVTTGSAQEWGQEGMRLIGESRILTLLYEYDPFIRLIAKG